MDSSRHIWRSRRARREAGWALFFLVPSLMGVLLFVLAPSAQTLVTALTDLSGSLNAPANFRAALGNEAFQMAASNTLRFMGVCVPLLLALSLLLALGLSSAAAQSPALRACFLLPMAVPVSSVAFFWQLMLGSHGVLNGVLWGIGMAGSDWMNTSASFWALVVSYIWRNIGYDMVLMLAALSAISPSLYEAARIDGAGSWRCFRHVTLPLLMPSLYTVAVLSLLNAFKVYREVYLLAGSYPNENIYMMQHLFNNWFSRLEMGRLSAAAVMVALVAVVLIALLERAWGREDLDA